jgi:HK97 gp10 family phage protein
MSVQWFGSRVTETIRAATVQGLNRGVEDVANEAVSLMNNSPRSGRTYVRRGVAHRASGPGEPPAPDTGQLMASITTSVDEAALTGNVNAGTAYSQFLEYGSAKMAPRPFMRPALVNKRDAARQDIAEEIGRALK